MELEDFKTSEVLVEFNKAFAAFQGELTKVHRDSKNPHFQSNYASVEAVLDAIKGPLKTHGLSFLQLPLGGVEVCRLLVRIVHKSGEFIQWVFATPIAKKDPQGMGAAITYSRRYTLTSALGLPEVDDDGNAASIPVKSALQANTAMPAGKPRRGALSEPQIKRLYAIAKQNSVGLTDVGEFMLIKWGSTSMTDLSRPAYDDICNAMSEGRFYDSLAEARAIKDAPTNGASEFVEMPF